MDGSLNVVSHVYVTKQLVNASKTGEVNDKPKEGVMTQQNTILITGTSSGIGRTTAKLFQQKGWNVIATMRKPEDEKELNKLGGTLVTRLDVTDSASIEAAVKAGIERFGAIDVLVNNAGFGAYGPLEATPIDKIRRQFDTNVFGVLQTTKALLPHFRANRSGTIINVSSIGGKIAFPLGTLYHGTKFAVEGLSEALSYEMAAIGVRVKLVEPGAVKTEFGGQGFNFNNDESLAEYQEMVGKTLAGFVPFNAQASDPMEVAEAIYTAAADGKDQLRYIAGEGARSVLANRKAADDESFMKGIREMFSL